LSPVYSIPKEALAQLSFARAALTNLLDALSDTRTVIKNVLVVSMTLLCAQPPLRSTISLFGSPQVHSPYFGESSIPFVAPASPGPMLREELSRPLSSYGTLIQRPGRLNPFSSFPFQSIFLWLSLPIRWKKGESELFFLVLVYSLEYRLF